MLSIEQLSEFEKMSVKIIATNKLHNWILIDI